MQFAVSLMDTISEPSKKMKPDGIGELLGKNGGKFAVYPVFLGAESKFAVDGSNFLRILNDLFNSVKHSVVHQESHSLFGREFPTVISFSSKNNNFTDGYKYHNHNAYHLMMGFQDCVARVLINLRLSTDS